MAWFKRSKAPITAVAEQKKVQVPEGVWTKCKNCNEIIYTKEVERNLNVCPKCDYHFRISARERISLVIDQGSFVEMDANMESVDFLDFKDSKRYKDRIKAAVKKNGGGDAVVCGQGTIEGMPVAIGVFDFGFLGGSMGSVVGEKLTRAIEAGLENGAPVIIFSSSGGARMQESILSLMQMAKTSAALAKLKSAGLPFISVLTDPTTGGVTASFAMLGDINMAEPKALIGFAGPRVIEQTIRQTLPEGFQRSEYLLEHGMIDMIVRRQEMKQRLSQILRVFTNFKRVSNSCTVCRNSASSWAWIISGPCLTGSAVPIGSMASSMSAEPTARGLLQPVWPRFCNTQGIAQGSIPLPISTPLPSASASTGPPSANRRWPVSPPTFTHSQATFRRPFSSLPRPWRSDILSSNRSTS